MKNWKKAIAICASAAAMASMAACGGGSSDGDSSSSKSDKKTIGFGQSVRKAASVRPTRTI